MLDHTDKVIEIVTAYKNGGPQAVEYRMGGEDMFWVHPYTHPGWDFEEIEWRLTPSPPKPREYTVRLCPETNNGLPEIGGIKKDWGACPKCELFIVREVFPSSGEPQFNSDGSPNCVMCGKPMREHTKQTQTFCPRSEEGLEILDEQGRQPKRQTRVT